MMLLIRSVVLAELPRSVMAPEAVRKLASDVVVVGFPLLVSDLIRRAHPLHIHRFLGLKTGLGNLPAGLWDDHPWMVRSTAVIDLSSGPMVVEFPDLGERYFSLTIVDAACRPWASFGSSTGAAKSSRLVLGGFNLCSADTGDLPTFSCETDLHWAVGRIMANSEAEVPVVAGLATQLRLFPLGDATLGFDEAVGGNLELDGLNPVHTLSRMSSLEFLYRLEALATREFPAGHPAGATKLQAQAQALLQMGQDSQESTSQAIEQGLAEGMATIVATSRVAGARTGWQKMPSMGPHDNALTRAVLALQTTGAPIEQDRLTYTCGTDETGRKLTGNECYWLHFAPEWAQPSDAFWSIAIVSEVSGKEPGARPQWLGSSHGVVRNEDDSLDILIACEHPGGLALYNWLQAPLGAFELRFHLYRAKGGLTDPGWQMPPVERLGSNATRKLDLSAMPNMSPPAPGLPEALTPERKGLG
jgi:hypothetical protein